MTERKKQRLRVLVFVGLTVQAGASGQVNDRSPSDLIKSLTRQSESTQEPGQDDRLDCRVDTEGRAAYKALLDFGPKAIPAIEKYLESLRTAEGEKPTAPAYNAQWVLYAYARIEGTAAFPRLWEMAYDPKLFGLRLTLLDSFALAFDLTSYVSELYPAAGVYHCHFLQPRDGLNRLILGWERGDEALVQASLGPEAKATLHSLLEHRTWTELRAELSSGTTHFGFGIGYRFDVPSPWSVPEVAAEDFKDATSESRPELETRFKTMRGQDCGTYHVRFLRTPTGEIRLSTTYLVDNPDLAGLLRLIGSCATQ